MSQKEDAVEVEGLIVAHKGGDHFDVELKIGESKSVILAYPSGKVRKNKIQLLVGDRVKVLLSQYDLTKGRIVWRQSNRQ